jgi:hypothetical protein
VKVGGQNLTLSGSSGLDQTLNYNGTIAIPRKDLGNANAAVDGVLAQLNIKGGSNIKLNEILNIGMVLGGTFTKPTISTNLADIAKNEANSLKNQVADEINKKKKELEDKAKAEAERLKAEAEKLKKETETKVKAEADRLKKEAEAKAKSEAEKAKNKLEEEAKKKLKGLFNK